MKKRFLQLSLLFTVSLASVLFSSCKKDDNPSGGRNKDGSFTITATNVINSSLQISAVKAEPNDAIATAPYKNNGFELTLPATLPSKYLYLITEDLDEDEFDNITISDKDAKILDIWADQIEAYDNDERNIGYFDLEAENDNSDSYVVYFYTDRNLKIKAELQEYEDGEEFIGKMDMDLKKGWNIVYYTETESGNKYTLSYTTQKPLELNYFWNYYSYKSTKANTDSFGKRKSLFSRLNIYRNK